MIPLPNLGLGFTGGTTKPENYGNVGGGLNTGGLTFGGKGLNTQTLVIIGVAAVALLFVLRKYK